MVSSQREPKPFPDLTILPGGLPKQAAEPSPAEESLQDYLDHLCAPLVGILPYRERSDLRDEAAYHIERLANTYLLDGYAEDGAMRRAIEKYGEPQLVADQFLEAWQRHQPQGRLARRIGFANAVALAWFGLATLLVTGLLQFRVYMPDRQPLRLGGFTVEQMRRLIPQPLPLPEASPSFYLLLTLTLLLPLAAGWLTGSRVLVRPASAIARVLPPLIIYSFVSGVLMLPVAEGLLLALAQLFWWLPSGMVAAHIAALNARRTRCRYRAGRLNP